MKVEAAVNELIEWKNGFSTTGKKRSTDRLEARRLLHGLIHTHFDADDLKQLCFEMAIIHDDLGEGGHDHRILELIMMIIREGRQAQFLKALERHRPGVAWPTEFS